jgi:hypothetical protein
MSELEATPELPDDTAIPDLRRCRAGARLELATFR